MISVGDISERFQCVISMSEINGRDQWEMKSMGEINGRYQWGVQWMMDFETPPEPESRMMDC